MCCSAEILAIGLPALDPQDWHEGMLLSTGTYGDTNSNGVLTGARSLIWTFCSGN